MFFYDFGSCDAGLENRDLMVHLQRLLPIEIEIANIVYSNDCLYNTINNPVPFAVHLQLLHEKFRPIIVYLQDVLLWTGWHDLLYLHSTVIKIGLRPHDRSFETKDLHLQTV